MIRVQGVSAGYGGLDILRRVDLHVQPGSIHCIVGPNGAGKSTVLKTISGVLTPRAGAIQVAGQELAGKSPDAILRAGVVQVPQRYGLFARLTVRQNVLMGAYINRRRRREVKERYCELQKLFPILASRADTLAGALSGGQRRMVEFARAMMLEPAVVLLDEPSLGLDPRSLAVINDAVLTMKATGATILMVEQNVRFGLGLASHATVMSAGTVALSGTAAEIQNHPDLMRLFFGQAPAQVTGTTSTGQAPAAMQVKSI